MKDAVLLAKLAIDGPQSRWNLCDLFWPEASREQASNSLRQRAFRFGKKMGQTVIELGGTVGLAPGVRVDAAQPESLSADELRESGTLLAGLDLGENDGLDRWVLHARARLDERCAGLLADHAQALESAGRIHEALGVAARVVELKPLTEHGWRRLMRLHYIRNDRGAAQEAFWRMRSMLRDELGIRPSAETLQLMQTIEMAEDHATLMPALRPLPASLQRPPAMVGRTAAWQAMSAAWERGDPFLLIGEAGIGKSRLLEDFADGRQGVVIDKASPGDVNSPYAVLGRVLVEIERRLSPPADAFVRGELARLRPEFGPCGNGAGSATLLLGALREWLQAALDRGLTALILDDLHCADAATIEALRWLSGIPAMRRLRLGLATRPFQGMRETASLEAWLQDSSRPAAVFLEPLTRAEVGEFLASLTLPELLNANLAERIHRHAGGNPLFTLATLQEAICGAADLGAPHWKIPSSVQALLDSRLSNLTPAAQNLLRVAAVAGADLRADRAARWLGTTVLNLSAPWAELERLDVLRGEAFSHDLFHESALRSIPSGVRQALHRDIALLLTEDADTDASRIAWHWEHGLRWIDAARCWRVAGAVAKRAGRLLDQVDMLERSARCFRAAGDSAGEFDSLYERLDALQLRQGGRAVLAVLPQLEALAEHGQQHLRCRMARVEALLDIEQAGQALADSEESVDEAEQSPDLHAQALALHAQVLAQCRQFEAAIGVARQSLAASRHCGDGLQLLRSLSAASYVYYASGRLADALAHQKEAVKVANELGHRAEMIANEGHVAALLAAIGNVPQAYATAARVAHYHRRLGVANDSTLGSVNHIVLGASAAALGRFDQALEALQAAVDMAGLEAAPAARAKARIALASLWVGLGCGSTAHALLDEAFAHIVPGMRMQVEWLRARAAEVEGWPATRHWQALGRLASEHAELPLVQSAVFETSWQGEPFQAIERLRAATLQCEAFGLHGTGRALRWRELARWLDIPGDAATESALQIARALQPHVATGLSAKCYVRQVWLTLSAAYERGNEPALRAVCMDAGRRWVMAATGSVPGAHLATFRERNPVNRLLLREG